MSEVSRRQLLLAAPTAGALATALIAGRVAADQPRMQAALDALKVAERELVAASPDKGGHRARALKLVREAIAQVERGIHYDRRH